MKTKKILSLILSLLMVLTMVPQTAFATELQPEVPGPAADPACVCAELPLCAEGALNDCAVCAADASACLGKAAESDPAPEGDSEPDGETEPDGEPEAKLVTAWTWIDEFEIIKEGSIASPRDSFEWDELVPMLPDLSATVDGAEETLPLDWSCADVAEGLLAAGVHTLTATLPAGYALAQGVDALTLTLEMGGGEAFADGTDTELYVNGVKVNMFNTSGAGWSYYSNTNTLMLNGFNGTTNGESLSVIGYNNASAAQKPPLTIELVGDNYIATAGKYGIGKADANSTGGLVFIGAGSLTISGATDYAIFANNAELKVGDSGNDFTGKLEVSGGKAGLYSVNSMELLGGTVIAKGKNGIETTSAKGITIKNCTVTAEGEQYGIHTQVSNAKITIENSTVTATGIGSDSCGIYFGEGWNGENSVLDFVSGKLIASGTAGAVGFKKPSSATVNPPATTYRWRTAADGAYTNGGYTYNAADNYNYLEFTTETAYDLWIDGAQVTSNGLSGEGWVYDPDTGILTLDGFNGTQASQEKSHNAVIRYWQPSRPMTIELKGQNKITISENYGIFAHNQLLTFTGNGTLVVDGTNNGYKHAIFNSSHGIVVDLESDGKLDVTGYHDGLHAGDTLEIRGGEVIVNGTSDSEGRGIYAMNGLSVSDGSLIAKGDKAAIAFGSNGSVNSLPTDYWWRTSASGAYTQSSVASYEYDNTQTYVEITTEGPKHAHDGFVFDQAWTVTAGEVTGGNYYLDGDVEATGNITINGEVKLCLNGKTLHMSAVDKNSYDWNHKIEVKQGASLTICDCSEGDAGTINGENQYWGNTLPLIENNKGTVTMLGGTLKMRYDNCIRNKGGTVMLEGGTVGKQFTGGATCIRNKDGGTLIIDGATVKATNSENAPSGPAVNNDNGTVEIKSGLIKGSSITNKDKMHISGGKLELPSGISMQGGWSIPAVLYLSGNPSFTVDSLDGGHIAQTGMIKIHAQSNSLPYTGSPLTVELPYDSKDGDIVVYDVTADNAGKFAPTPEAELKEYAFVRDGNNLVVKDLHVHKWSYVANGGTITSLCNELQCVRLGKGEMIINAKDDEVYDNTQREAKLSGKILGKETGFTPEIKYYDSEGALLQGAPKDAGEYYACITVDGATAKAEFTIEKADQPNVTATVESYVYGGTVSKPKLSGEVKENAQPAYYYNTQNSTTDGTLWTALTNKTLTPGTYYVYAELPATTNYNEYTTEPVAFEVQPKTLVEGDDYRVQLNEKFYDGQQSELVEVTGLSSGVTVRYGMEEGKYDLPVAPQFREAGEYTVYYQVSKENYATVTGSETVSIEKAQLKAVLKNANGTYGPFTKEYDGTTKAPEGVYVALERLDRRDVDFNNVVIADIAFARSDAGPTKIHVSNVTLPADAAANYELPEKYQAFAVDAEITKATNAWTEELSIIDWTYGQPSNAPTATAKIGEVEFTYLDINENPLSDKPTDAGTYYVKATVAASPNYTELEATKQFQIFKAQAAKPSKNNTTFTYNGTEQNYFSSVTDNLCYTVDGNARTDAGTQTVTVALKNKDNYQWSDGSTENLTFEFTIEPAQLTPSIVPINGEKLTKPYDGGNDASRIADIQLNGVVSGDEDSVFAAATITFDDEKVGDNKTLTATGIYLLGEKAGNYILTTESATETASITKARPTVSAAPTPVDGLRYNGDKQELVTGGTTTGGTMQYRLDEQGDWSENIPTAIEVGKYSVYYSIKGNENYEDVQDGSYVTSTIQKALAPEMTWGVQMVRNHAGYDIAVDLKGAAGYPKNPGGTPKFEVTSTNYNGLTKATVNEDGVLTLVSNADSEDTADTVTIAVTNMGNYEDGVITVNVTYTTKTVVTISGVTAKDGIYNGKPHVGYTGTPTSAAGNKLSDYEVTYNTTNGEAPTQAGNYTVTFTVPDSNRQYTGSTTLNFTVSKAEVAAPAANTKTFFYNGSDQTYTLTENDVLYTISNNVRKVVGTQQVTVALNDKTNYCWSDSGNSENKTYDFRIVAMEVAAPAANTATFTYNGSAQTYTLETSEWYTIAGNVQTNAGTYTVTVALKDTANTRWTDGTTTDRSYSFVIAKMQVTAPDADTTTFTYDGSEKTYSLATSDWYNITGDKKTNAGAYKVTVALKDTKNTCWSDDSIEDKTYDFVIGKQPVAAPAIATKTYTGAVLTAEIVGNDLYTVEKNDGGTDVGEYDVVLKLTDTANTKWADSEAAEKTLTFAIEAAKNEWTTQPGITGWTYSETASEPVGEAKFGTVEFTYYDSDKQPIEKPVNAGSYFMIASVKANGSNYAAMKTDFLSFAIKKATPDVTVPGQETSLSITTGKTLKEVALPEGWAWDAPDAVVTYGDNAYPATYTKDDSGNYETVTENVIVIGTDVTAPTGSLTISTNTWSSFLSDITFGLFFKETQKVTVTAQDAESGVSKTEYHLSDRALTAEEAEAITDWTEFTGNFSIDPNNRYVVYVKITDKAGNIAIINSNGVVLDDIAPVLSGIEDGKTYYGSVTVTVNADDLDRVEVNGKPVTLQNGKLVLSIASGPQVIRAYDKAGNVSAEFTVYVTSYPTYRDDIYDGLRGENADGECGCAMVDCSVLNLRKTPSLFGKRIGKLPRDTRVTVLSTENGWSRVRLLDGTEGYVFHAYLREQCWCSGQYAVVLPRVLNVRTGPSTDYKRIGKVRRGQWVEVLETENGWSKIVWEDGTAYVCTKYLSLE